MRVVGGICGGRIITPPNNLKARPTTDFAKENIFNVLSNIIYFEEADVLDLFAGTGSISYEFASRGVRSVISVEINAVHENFIRQTAQKFGLSAIHPIKANVFLYLKSCNRQFEIIFADAPYDLPNSADVITLVFEHNLLKKDGVLIFEHSKEMNFASHPHFMQTRSYGSVRFTIFG